MPCFGCIQPLARLDVILSYGRSLPFTDVLWNADLSDVLGAEADNYWLTARRFVIEHLRDFAETATYLADDMSVRTLAALIRYRITGEPDHHPDFNLGEQYFPPGILRLSRQISFVDGGAFDGDTFRHLCDKGVEISDWAAFEPDPRNFEKLTGFARDVPVRSALFPYGLSDKFSQIRFAADGATSSHIAASGEITIPCVALDDVLPKLKPDYIKLDIEGAEAAALRGMAGAIGRARPHLAVSAYHRPDDLWMLPRLMRELAPYAKLYLRQHEANAFETVLYGVPA
jgi:FkbM family methyltransferase